MSALPLLRHCTRYGRGLPACHWPWHPPSGCPHLCGHGKRNQLWLNPARTDHASELDERAVQMQVWSLVPEFEPLLHCWCNYLYLKNPITLSRAPPKRRLSSWSDSFLMLPFLPQAMAAFTNCIQSNDAESAPVQVITRPAAHLGETEDFSTRGEHKDTSAQEIACNSIYKLLSSQATQEFILPFNDRFEPVFAPLHDIFRQPTDPTLAARYSVYRYPICLRRVVLSTSYEVSQKWGILLPIISKNCKKSEFYKRSISQLARRMQLSLAKKIILVAQKICM